MRIISASSVNQRVNNQSFKMKSVKAEIRSNDIATAFAEVFPTLQNRGDKTTNLTLKEFKIGKNAGQVKATVQKPIHINQINGDEIEPHPYILKGTAVGNIKSGEDATGLVDSALKSMEQIMVKLKENMKGYDPFY